MSCVPGFYMAREGLKAVLGPWRSQIQILENPMKELELCATSLKTNARNSFFGEVFIPSMKYAISVLSLPNECDRDLSRYQDS